MLWVTTPKNGQWEEGEDRKTQRFPVLEHIHTQMNQKKKMVVCCFCSVGPEVFHHGKKEAENADFSKVLHKVLFLIRKKETNKEIR